MTTQHPYISPYMCLSIEQCVWDVWFSVFRIFWFFLCLICFVFLCFCVIWFVYLFSFISQFWTLLIVLIFAFHISSEHGLYYFLNAEHHEYPYCFETASRLIITMYYDRLFYAFQISFQVYSYFQYPFLLFLIFLVLTTVEYIKIRVNTKLWHIEKKQNNETQRINDTEKPVIPNIFSVGICICICICVCICI